MASVRFNIIRGPGLYNFSTAIFFQGDSAELERIHIHFEIDGVPIWEHNISIPAHIDSVQRLDLDGKNFLITGCIPPSKVLCQYDFFRGKQFRGSYSIHTRTGYIEVKA